MKWASGWLVLLSLMATGLLACGGSPPPGTLPPSTLHPSVPHLDIRCTFEDGQPIAGVSVVLGEVGTGVTDSDGQLSFDIPPGQYTARLHLKADDGRESKTEQSIEVGDQPQQVTLKLPRPVQLLEPLEVTTSRVHLAWERSGESHFRGYKIYARHGSSAFDEQDGQLVYEGTDVSQTDYMLADLMVGGSPFVTASSDIYFRVFVFQEDGSMAGSNALHVKTPRWDNEPHFTRFYSLSIDKRFAGELPVRGIAYDGDSLWLLYWEELGGYYVDDRLTLVQLEPGTWKVLKEFFLMDRGIPRGLTWDGGALWIGFFDGNLVRVDASTGLRERSITGCYGLASLTWSGSQIVQSSRALNSTLEGVDPLSGAIMSSRPSPFTLYGPYAPAGIAARPGEVWLANEFLNDLVIIDDAGTHIGVVSSSLHFAHMTFMGKQLVGVTPSSQIIIMNIQE